MSVSIDIPQDAEDALRQEWGGNLEQAAKEALLIESYRTGRISIGYLAELLGLSRCETETWLGSRGVHWNYDLDDLESDRKTLAELLAEGERNGDEHGWFTKDDAKCELAARLSVARAERQVRADSQRDMR